MPHRRLLIMLTIMIMIIKHLAKEREASLRVPGIHNRGTNDGRPLERGPWVDLGEFDSNGMRPSFDFSKCGGRGICFDDFN